MKKIREVLKLNAEGNSLRKIAKSQNISRRTVKDYIDRACEAKLKYPLPAEMNDSTLELMLFPQRAGVSDFGRMRKPEPDYNYIHKQLRKRKDATLEVLHCEFLEQHPDGISYPLMCNRYRKFKGKLKRYLRKTYKGGEIVFVDYSGRTVPIYDLKENTFRTAQVFVGVLAASNYTFAEATLTQKIPDWIESHNNMFAFFNGVPAVVTPDNLKSAVTRPGRRRSEPKIQETYRDMASHYGTVILPARVRKPQDKGKAEFGVRHVQRWILFSLRHNRYTELGTLNADIMKLLDKLNKKPFQKLPGCRRSAFEEIDKPELKPLPRTRYEYVIFQKVRAGADYHVVIDKHSYSVPYQNAHDQLEAQVSSRIVEVFFKRERIASHVLSHKEGGITTLDEHMPPGDFHYERWNADSDLKIASTIGLGTTKFLEIVFADCVNHDEKYRQSIAFMNLRRDHDDEDIEASTHIALDSGLSMRVCTLAKLIKSRHLQPKNNADDIIEANFDHDFVRGPDYYN